MRREARVFGPHFLVRSGVLDRSSIKQRTLSVCLLVVVLYRHVNVGRGRENLRMDVFFAIVVQVKRRFLRASLEF